MKKACLAMGGTLALAAVLLLAVRAAPAAPAAETPAPAPEVAAPGETPAVEAKFVASQWFALYLAGKKIGYTTRSLYELPAGHRRLVTNQFLRQGPGIDRYGYFKMISAEVDAAFRPHAVECRTVAGERQWLVQGHIQDGRLRLKRTAGTGDGAAGTGDGEAGTGGGAAGEASIRVAADEDVTFLSWVLPATLMTGAKTGETRSWLVIDESLGALLPSPYVVQVTGHQGMVSGPAGAPAAAARAVVCSFGPEQVIHVVDKNGQVLRSVWQSTPMVAESVSLSEARQLIGVPEGPHGAEIEGLTTDRYQSVRLGLSLRVPPYPYVVHVAAQAGAVEVADLTDEAYLSLQPLPGLRSGAGPVTEAELKRQADLLQSEWASRFEDVTAELVRSDETASAASAVRTVQGTARLGCTTFHFRNSLLAGSGLPWFASVAVADRPLVVKPLLTQTVAESIRLTPPEGQLPLHVAGDLVRSSYYGFEVRRPSGRWKIPAHMEGPVTALEMARDDGAAVAVIRLFTPKPGRTLEAFVADQARAAAENLDVTRPDPKPAMLAGRKAVEITYTGQKVLSGNPARCAAVYVPFESQVLALFLMVRTDADESAANDVRQIRESLKLPPPAAANEAPAKK